MFTGVNIAILYLSPYIIPFHYPNGHTRQMPLIEQLLDILPILLGEGALLAFLLASPLEVAADDPPPP